MKNSFALHQIDTPPSWLGANKKSILINKFGMKMCIWKYKLHIYISRSVCSVQFFIVKQCVRFPPNCRMICQFCVQEDLIEATIEMPINCSSLSIYIFHFTVWYDWMMNLFAIAQFFTNVQWTIQLHHFPIVITITDTGKCSWNCSAGSWNSEQPFVRTL